MDNIEFIDMNGVDDYEEELYYYLKCKRLDTLIEQIKNEEIEILIIHEEDDKYRLISRKTGMSLIEEESEFWYIVNNMNITFEI